MALLRTNFPAESKIQNATLEPTGKMKRESDKCKLTLKFDRHRNYWFLGAGDDHCLAARRLQDLGALQVTILDME